MEASDQQERGPWGIVVDPVGKNPGKLKKAAQEAGIGTPHDENIGGMIVSVQNTQTGRKDEVSRVAFVRRASKNPKVAFKTQLDKEVAKAKDAVEVLNGLFTEAGELV